MKTRKRVRGDIYFDSIDLEILNLVENPPENKYGWNILDITDYLNIGHLSLKPHIDKLLRLGLIKPFTIMEARPRVYLLATPKYNEILRDINFENLNEKKLKEMKIEEKNYEIVKHYLSGVEIYLNEKEIEKSFNLDLRRRNNEIITFNSLSPDEKKAFGVEVTQEELDIIKSKDTPKFLKDFFNDENISLFKADNKK